MIFGPGLAATMYMSAGVCGIGLTILGLFLPETKGKLLTHWLFVAAHWMTSTWQQAPSGHTESDLLHNKTMSARVSDSGCE